MSVFGDVAIEAHVPLEDVSRHAEYWVGRSGIGCKRGLHVPAPESTRDKPRSLCANGRAQSVRVIELEQMPESHLEGRVCAQCTKELMRDGRISLPAGVRNNAIPGLRVSIVQEDDGR